MQLISEGFPDLGTHLRNDALKPNNFEAKTMVFNQTQTTETKYTTWNEGISRSITWQEAELSM